MMNLKFDPNSAFEWQRDTSSQCDVLWFQTVLKFFGRSCPSNKGIADEGMRWLPATMPTTSTMEMQSAYLAHEKNSCLACSTTKYLLYICSKSKPLPTEQFSTLTRKKNLCLIGLRSGHYSMLYVHYKKYGKCHNSHHTLLHHRTDDGSLLLTDWKFSKWVGKLLF